MQLYRFTNQLPGEQFDPQNDHEAFKGTRGDAKELIKTVLPTDRVNYFIELVEVSTSKESILKLLAGQIDATVLKRWKFTSRGGIHECDASGHVLEDTQEADS